MNAKTDRQKSKAKKYENINFDKKIEFATQTLERNIGFIKTCDSKTSIVLTALGVCFTIIFTTEGLHAILDVICKSIESVSFCDIILLFCIVFSFALLLVGIINLVSVLFGRVDLKTKKENISSSKTQIFFYGIAENSDCMSYKKRFINMSDKQYLNYLITEIYVNSQIASMKYNKYNRGLKLTCIGFGSFLLFSLIGIYIY